MSTPLYRHMKDRGTSFYAFPSTSTNPNPKFSKFVLLNIPQKEEDKILDFNSPELEAHFNIYTDKPHTNQGAPYSELLVESLRNYVSNYDTTMKESKKSQVNDFYNIKEKQTPTEKIFWKWLRKFNAIDFEPAENKIDWNKNLPDFENPNQDTISNTDFFRKYLWKEREVKEYQIDDYTHTGNNDIKIVINYPAKFKVGDSIIINGIYDDDEWTNTYDVLDVEEDQTETKLTINEPNHSQINEINTVKLNYHKLVQYVGEINTQSEVHTASKDETEVTAYIPHQAGKTPTIMWETKSDSNYYPGLELPLLPEQIQIEIRGAQNLNSPIRQDPSDYPGLYYGQFDDNNRTYKNSFGDRIRYSGDYYGILRNNNVGLNVDNYVERLSEFNSNNIDGISLDFNLNHYLKMDILDESVGFNFDEFNQLSIDGNPPKGFSYNAILWYYETDETDEEDTDNIVHNLYGITFLNNPDNSDTGEYITPYEKLVQNEEHDGISYIHVLNLSTSVDNDTSTLSFDPLTLNNMFGFDLYSNVMSNVGKLNESFINIINQFVKINEDLNNLKSVIYSQTDINLIKNKLSNLEELLRLYSKYQFVDTDTVRIDQNYGGTYPTLGFNVRGIEYEDVISTTTSNIKERIDITNHEYILQKPETNKLFLKITNDDIINYGDLDILFDTDLNYKQSATIYIDANDALFYNKINIFMNFYDESVGGSNKILMDKVYTPVDIDNIVADEIRYSKTRWMNESTHQIVNLVIPDDENPEDRTLLYITNGDVFGNPLSNQLVYVDSLFMKNNNTNEIVDFSKPYYINSLEYSPIYVKINENTVDYTSIGVPKIYLYKGIKINIMRIDSTTSSNIKERYLIEKTFI